MSDHKPASEPIPEVAAVVEAQKIETVSGDFYTEPGEPFWRIEIAGYCADFDHEQAATNFAAEINSLLSAQAVMLEEAREVANEARLQLEYMDVRSPSGTTPAVIAKITEWLAKLEAQSHVG
jgi:hypothetical protein